MATTDVPAPTRRVGAGFTLLEVMAAVAIFGLVYVVIARVAIGGLGLEGDAERRLRASLLADRALTEIEIALRAGAAPRLGRTERSEDEFRVAVDVAPLDPAQLGLAEALAPPATGAALGAGTGATPAPSLLTPAPGSGAAALLGLEVHVRWDEGGVEQEVVRTSFALDLAAAAPLLEGLAGEGEPPLPGEDRTL